MGDLQNTWVDPADVWDMLVEQAIEQASYDTETILCSLCHAGIMPLMDRVEIVRPPLVRFGPVSPAEGEQIKGIAFDGGSLMLRRTLAGDLQVLAMEVGNG